MGDLDYLLMFVMLLITFIGSLVCSPAENTESDCVQKEDEDPSLLLRSLTS